MNKEKQLVRSHQEGKSSALPLDEDGFCDMSDYINKCDAIPEELWRYVCIPTSFEHDSGIAVSDYGRLWLEQESKLTNGISLKKRNQKGLFYWFKKNWGNESYLWIKVDRLVVNAFVENYGDVWIDDCIVHLDGDTHNCKLDNLVVVTGTPGGSERLEKSLCPHIVKYKKKYGFEDNAVQIVSFEDLHDSQNEEP